MRGKKVYDDCTNLGELYDGSEEKSLCLNERGQQLDRVAVV